MTEEIDGHPIITVERPVRFLVLTHHEHEVRISLDKIARLLRLEWGTDHLGFYEFSWTERTALERAGLILMDIRSGAWASDTLRSQFPDRYKL